MTGNGISAIWQRFCPVGGITTELLGINAVSDPPHLQVVVFPGNPGSAAYFKPFMLAVHRLLRGRADVLAVTHAGHDPETDHGGRLWDLSDQISHKVSYLREHVLLPGRAPVLLVGHSIGASMMIRAVSQIEGLDPSQLHHSPFKVQQQRPPILKLVAVFPFFETNFSGNWRQRRLRSLAPWYDYLGWLGAAVTSLPRPLRTAFVRSNAAMDSDAVELTCRLLSRHTVRNAFFLATHEFKELSQPWDWSLLASLGPRLHVLGCEKDTWLSRRQYDDMMARVPGLQATWHPDLRHAFCVSGRQSLAVAETISAVARSIPDLNLDLGPGLDLATRTARTYIDAPAAERSSLGSETSTATAAATAAAETAAAVAASKTETITTSSETSLLACRSPKEASYQQQQQRQNVPNRHYNQLGNEPNHHCDHHHHQPHGDQLVPCGETSQQGRQLYGDDVIVGHHHHQPQLPLPLPPAASLAPGCCTADVAGGDVGGAADQAAGDDAIAALYGKTALVSAEAAAGSSTVAVVAISGGAIATTAAAAPGLTTRSVSRRRVSLESAARAS